MGQIVKHYDAINAPQMHKRFNYDIEYDGEGKRGTMLNIANYKSNVGDVGHPVDTWVLMEKK